MNRKRYAVALALLATAVLLNLPLPASVRVRSGLRENIAPFQNVMTLVVRKTETLTGFIVGLHDAASERDELLLELAMLRSRIRDLEGLARENALLREQLGFRTESPRSLLPARVIARDGMNGWWQTVRLNMGWMDGVRQEMAVMAAEGVVGRVAAVSPRTCEVLLLSDPNCKIPCRVARSSTFGVLKGGGLSLNGKPRMSMLYGPNASMLDYLPMDADIGRGDVVETSGLGGVFPEGLPLGRVRGVETDGSGLYQRAEVVALAPLDRLRNVFVVMENSGTGGAP